MIKAYIDFWKRAFDFSGRSTRPDYWWVYLINVIISTILVVGFVLIPFFSNVSHNPAILNDSTEIQKIDFEIYVTNNDFWIDHINSTTVPSISSFARCRYSSGLGASKLYRACTNLDFLLIHWKYCTHCHVMSAN